MNLRLVIASCFALAAVACSKSESSSNSVAVKPAPAPAAAAPADPASQAKDIFNTRCSTCHGPGGTGDGPASAALNPKPRNYTDKTWQGSVTDDQIKKVIVGGGPSVGKSALMPPNSDLEGKPEVVAELVKIVRAFGK